MLDDTEKAQLKELAFRSICDGLGTGEPLVVAPEVYGGHLQQVGASFVTLHSGGHLRGCVGTVTAHRALVADVVANAYAAAFLDGRFEPLGAEEVAGLELRISVLSPCQLMDVGSEQALLGQLKAGRDGLLLELGERHATFLPSVWAELPRPIDFFRQLKRKAGLDAEAWDSGMRLYRYSTDEF